MEKSCKIYILNSLYAHEIFNSKHFVIFLIINGRFHVCSRCVCLDNDMGVGTKGRFVPY
jgi:hypothetical protein